MKPFQVRTAAKKKGSALRKHKLPNAFLRYVTLIENTQVATLSVQAVRHMKHE
jgi:hypothetical protein